MFIPIPMPTLIYIYILSYMAAKGGNCRHIYLPTYLSIHLFMSSPFLSVVHQQNIQVTDALAEFMGLRGNSTADGMDNRRDKRVQLLGEEV